VPNRIGPAPRYQHLIPFLRRLYPGRGRATQDRYLSGLEPDLLGETLVWSVLTDPENTPETFLEQVFTGADETAIGNGFVVLGRISLQDPTVATPWLAGVLEADIPGRARRAFYAALALGTHTAFSPLGLILAEALERKGNLDHAVEFDPLVPQQTVSLREIAVWTGRRLLEFLSTQEDTEENLTERARLLSNLGVRLSDLGRREEALQAAQEALDIYRQLAKARPDAFLPDLATSLNNLGNRLSDLGRREEALQAAQEALDIYRQLAKARPDAFLPDLARSLGVLGTCLAADARLREAVAAFAEGVRALTPAFSRLPEAFAPLMRTLVSLYLTHTKELGESPDTELLAPILAKFEEIEDSEEGSKE
jgi:tetratricopeptide (TPR) repeat protein